MISLYEAQERIKTCTNPFTLSALETVVDLWKMFGETNSDLQEALDLLHIDREKLKERTAKV